MTKRQDSLLRDAIADAKAVRNTALANAKVYLEEAFTPHLTSMLAAKLRNEAEDEDRDEEETVDEAATLKDSPATDGHGSDEGGETDKEAISETSELKPATDGKGDNVQPEYHSADDDDDKEMERSFGKDGGKKLATETVGSEVDDVPMGDVEGGNMEVKKEGLGDAEHRKDDIDMEIESILGELEADADQFGDEDNDDYGLETDFGGAAGQAGLDDLNPDDTHEDEMQGTDVDEASADVANLAGSPMAAGAEHQEDGGIPVRTGAPVPGAEEDEIDLDALMREIADTDAEAKDSQAEDGHEKIRAENVNLKSNLAEYRKAVQLLRNRLVEVNLLNAKLLYTNKLFKSFNLDVGQKMRVIETFDRAATVRESKLVYATLMESFRPLVRSKTSTVKVVTEGMASKAIGGTKPKTESKVLNERIESSDTILGESTDMASRFRKLAGIKVNN